MLFFWGMLDGVSNLGENSNGNEEGKDDAEEQCQPSAEGDLGDQLVVVRFFQRLNFSYFF